LRQWFIVSNYWYGLIFDVHNDYIETVGWWISYYCILVQMDMRYCSVYMRLLIEQYPGLILYSCYWKLLKKYYRTMTYTLFYYATVYTVILSILLLLHHWDCYCHHIVPVIKITWILIVLNNNLNWQLTLGLRKLIKDTASVF